MPRRKRASGMASAFDQVQRQAQALIQMLRKEIRIKEVELHQLKEEESRLSSLAGRVRPVRGPRRAAQGGGRVARRGGRVNWRTVLSQLPRQFKAAHIRDIRGLKSKRPSEIFAAITRWIDAGLVKRKARGLYERVG